MIVHDTLPNGVRLVTVTPTSRETGLLRLVEVDVSHLSRGVHPGVRAPGHDQARIPADDAGKSILEHTLHGAQTRLPGPPAEVRAVVGDVETDAHGPSRVPPRRTAGAARSRGGSPEAL